MSEATDTPAGVQTDDIDITALATWGLVSVFITVALMFGLYGLYNVYIAEERVKKTFDVKYEDTTSVKDSQQQLLIQPIRYLDSEGKTLAVPISKAKELVLKEYSKKE